MSTPNSLRALLLALFLMGLTACGSRINSSNFEKIQTDMTSAEVTAILGEPTTSDSINVGPISGTQSTWKGKQNSISVQFLNGKVKAKQYIKTEEG